MGAIFRVARGDIADPHHDELAANYGWGPLHVFLSLIAVEERIPLENMKDYGGSISWDQADTILRPLFDLSVLDGDRLAATTCEEMLPRLSEIRDMWRSGRFSGDEPEGWMRELQLSNLDSLINVLQASVATGRGMTVR